MEVISVIYRYQGRQKDGTLREGQIEAANKEEANILLRNQGITAYQIKELHSILYKDIYIGNPVKIKDFVIFLRQYATMIDAGIPLAEATGALAEQSSNKVLRQTLKEIKQKLEVGSKLSDSMNDYPKIFPALLVNMVEAAEVSGNLDEVMEEMATYYEKQYELNQKVKTALTYPLVVGTFSMLIIAFLLIYIIPIFTDMFENQGSELPAFTQFISNASVFLANYWWAFVLGITASILIYRLAIRNEEFSFLKDKWKLKIPIFGSYIQKSLLARYTQTMSMLLASAVPFLQAIKITEKVMDNKVIQAVIRDSYRSIQEGKSLSSSLATSGIFPSFVTQMIYVGERSGEIEQMLKKVADFYERELEESSEKLKSLIEPILIIFLAIVVGSIVISIILPMFSLFSEI